jgi:hypothetical protein
MVDLADGLGEMLGAEPLDLIECELRSGGNHKVVIGDAGVVHEFDAMLRRMHSLGALRMKFDSSSRKSWFEIDRNVVTISPPHGDPGIRRDEGICAALVDHGHVVLATEQVSKLVSHDRAAEPGTQNDDISHPNLLCGSKA